MAKKNEIVVEGYDQNTGSVRGGNYKVADLEGQRYFVRRDDVKEFDNQLAIYAGYDEFEFNTEAFDRWKLNAPKTVYKLYNYEARGVKAIAVEDEEVIRRLMLAMDKEFRLRNLNSLIDVDNKVADRITEELREQEFENLGTYAGQGFRRKRIIVKD